MTDPAGIPRLLDAIRYVEGSEATWIGSGAKLGKYPIARQAAHQR